MRWRFVGVANELLQRRPQVALVHDDQVVEALAPRRPHHALRALDERAAIGAIPLANQEARARAPACDAHELTPDPRGRWVGAHIQIHQRPALVRDGAEHEQGSGGHGVDGGCGGTRATTATIVAAPRHLGDAPSAG